MNIDLQRWIDRWVGIPLCAAVSLVDAVTSPFRPSGLADKAPRAIVIILLSEMGSLVLAHDMFARLRERYPDAELHALIQAARDDGYRVAPAPENAGWWQVHVPARPRAPANVQGDYKSEERAWVGAAALAKDVRDVAP